MPRVLALLLLALLANPAAALTLAPLFCDGAVLQQGKPLPVWGQGDPGEKVTVTFHGQTKATTATADGHWSVNLDPLPASDKPADLVAAGTTTLQVHDVLVGEVWVCAGQSNMALQVLRANNYPEEKAAATDPLIRQFKVKLAESDTPAITLTGDWVSCSPATVGTFTAVGYFYARELRKALGVPVGIINTSYGGTPVESWMSSSALKDFPYVADRWARVLATYPARLKAYEEKKAAIPAGATTRPPRKPEGPGSRLTPSGLFNAMVNPLIPYAVKGILWYQARPTGRGRSSTGSSSRP